MNDTRRTLVVGDVHGCSAELIQLVTLAQANSVVLVGDLFTKGPDPAGVYRFIRERGCEAVLGNHDVRLLELSATDPEAARCCTRLDAQDPEWRAWLAGRPLTLTVGGYTVVHAALHPEGGETTRQIAINLRRWPDHDWNAPHWHDVYAGPKRVLFGHDALGGLVVHGEPPRLLGLDTGCVYGGALSGFLIEECAVYQVPAARRYAAVS